MQIYEFDGLIPVVDETAYVHPTAVLIGDVIVGPGCYVGANSVLRGDFGRLTLMQGSNLQDTCVMHGFPECDTVIEPSGHVGHGAVLHGCHIGRNAMVGMNAVVMDNAIVGEECIIAAMAFVKADMHVPPRTLFAGIPGKVVRELTQQEIDWKTAGTAVYQELAVRSRNMRPTAPLRVPEANRRRLGPIGDLEPMFKLTRK